MSIEFRSHRFGHGCHRKKAVRMRARALAPEHIARPWRRIAPLGAIAETAEAYCAQGRNSRSHWAAQRAGQTVAVCRGKGDELETVDSDGHRRFK